MSSGKNSQRSGLKICCGVTTLFLFIILVVSVVLFLTLLKPTQPQTIAHPVSLESIQFEFFPDLKLNVSLGLVVTVNNRNYGSFKYKDTTAYINYRGSIVAEAPIEHDTIPAHGKHNMSTSVEIIADKLIPNPYFKDDIVAGCLNFTSSTILHGKVSVFKILKMDATASSTCHISVYVQSQNAESECNSKIKF